MKSPLCSRHINGRAVFATRSPHTAADRDSAPPATRSSFTTSMPEGFDPILPDGEIAKDAPPARSSPAIAAKWSRPTAMSSCIRTGGPCRRRPQGLDRPRLPPGRCLRVRAARRDRQAQGQVGRSSSRPRTRPATTNCGCSATRWRTCGRPASSASAAWRISIAAISSRSS